MHRVAVVNVFLIKKIPFQQIIQANVKFVDLKKGNFLYRMEVSNSMKRFIQSVFFFLLIILSCNAWALPLDLSTFGADSGVTESGGVVSFEEQEDYIAIYFFDDNFSVPSNAVNLTYNYSLNLGDQNDDWLVAVINFTDYVMEIGNTGSGTWIIDLSSYQGQTISLAFGMESNDLIFGAVATISNLDLTTGTTAVPEPPLLLLLGSGLAGLFGIMRKRFISSMTTKTLR